MDENKYPDTDEQTSQQPEIYVNEYGSTKDSAVVVEEENRTVLLTPEETLILEKQPTFDINPRNRPRKVYAGMWGQAEIVSVGVGLLAVLTVLLLYVFLVIPSNSELERNRAERDRLERELATANAKYGNITSTETQVATLLDSVSNFETQYLPVASLGKNALYQRINGLIAAHGLVNTTGPDYSPLEFAKQEGEQNNDDQKGRSKFRSIFPGMYVTMTVEGSYQNLRRFIADIERSNDFVTISSIELEPSESNGPQTDDRSAPPAAEPAVPAGFGNPSEVSAGSVRGPKGKTHGETVSLRIELAAYFRRPNSVPVDPASATQ
jgi:Tfp pilus assembly protein PilO